MLVLDRGRGHLAGRQNEGGAGHGQHGQPLAGHASTRDDGKAEAIGIRGGDPQPSGVGAGAELRGDVGASDDPVGIEGRRIKPDRESPRIAALRRAASDADRRVRSLDLGGTGWWGNIDPAHAECRLANLG